VQAGHPVDCLFTLIVFLLSICTSLILSFSFHSLFTWHSHWYHKSSSEASASEALSGGISICKSSLRHQHLRDLLSSSRRMRCKSSSRHQFLTQAAINVAESKSLLIKASASFFFLSGVQLTKTSVTGITSPHLRHQLLKPSLEASASVSPL